jgi:hypothetical protein
MKGTIQQVTNTGNAWQAHGKTFYDFNYMIDGVTYVMSHIDNQPKFAAGEELDFEVTKQGNPKADGTVWPSKIKKIDPSFAPSSNGFTPSTPKAKGGIQKEMVLAYAKDIAVARINNGGMKAVSVDTVVKDYHAMLEALEPAPKEVKVPPHADPKVQAAPPIEEPIKCLSKCMTN